MLAILIATTTANVVAGLVIGFVAALAYAIVSNAREHTRK